jgi:hypothetical protein
VTQKANQIAYGTDTAPPAPQAQYAQQQGPPSQQSPVAHSQQAQIAAPVGYNNIHRASGGEVSRMPTNELIARALDIISRHKAAGGGAVNQGIWNGPQKNLPQGVPVPLSSLSPKDYGSQEQNDGAAMAWLIGLDPSQLGFGSQQQQAPQAAQTPPSVPGPAIPSGQVGNHGGNGAVSGTGSPIGTLPMAVLPSSSDSMMQPTSGPRYNNSLNQALGTNNPTMDQIFGFSYPTPPPPKPQPQGPVPQAEINGLYGFGGGYQTGTGTYNSGGAVIMDAALNTARKAIKGKKVNV